MPASFATVASPSAGVMADLDRDGNMDFAATNYTDRSVTVLYGMGKDAPQQREAQSEKEGNA